MCACVHFRTDIGEVKPGHKRKKTMEKFFKRLKT